MGVIAPGTSRCTCVGPLAAALAAGNRVMIKTSEYSPRKTDLLRSMLAECFAEERSPWSAVRSRPRRRSARCPSTTSCSPARRRSAAVMRAAAENLTPVTLELGGKSPAIVGPTPECADAATRITHGKTTNSGQICVSPDYALVPRARRRVRRTVRRTFDRCIGARTEGNPTTPRWSTSASAAHPRAARRRPAKGAKVDAPAARAGTGRQMPLHIVTGVRRDMRLMQEEIFGPILPVMAYDGVDEAIAHINAAAAAGPLRLQPRRRRATVLKRPTRAA